MPETTAAFRITHVEAGPETIHVSGEAHTPDVDLVEIAPYEAASVAQDRSAVRSAGVRDGRFHLEVPRWDDARDRLYSGWVARAGGDLSTRRYVERLDAGTRTDYPFPRAASKKGLQVQMIDDALALGVKHAALNVLLASMPDFEPRADSLTWEMDGETFHFNRRTFEELDSRIRQLSGAGVVVYLIMLMPDPRDADRRRLLLHPRYDPAAPNHLGAFNTATPDGLKWFKAMWEFTTARYSQPDQAHGRAVAYILGNEVNSHWWWYNEGHVPMREFAEDYLRTLRVASMAVRKQYTHARVYISLEHHWMLVFGGDETKAFRGKEFVDYLAARAREEGDFPWHLAYHPYPENLFECRTWNDKTALPRDDSPRITFKNLEVLNAYFGRAELLYDGRRRRIVLSEQGFHTADRPDGERDQAAAYCYAYYRAAHLPGIDAFILHRHVDHKGEGGLKLGLWTWKEDGGLADPGRKKMIYNVFMAADTPHWREAFRFALPVIGIREWKELDQPQVDANE